MNALASVVAGGRRRAPSGGGYLVAEDWDGSGVPSGWTFDGIGTFAPDTTGGGSPQGGHVLFLQANGNYPLSGGVRDLGGSYASIWGYCQLMTSGFGNQNRSFLLTDIEAIYASGGPNWQGAAVSGLSAWTWLHLWWNTTPTLSRLWVGTTATRPGSPAASVSGTFGATTKANLSWSHGGSSVYVDKYRLSTAEIGDNPA